MRITVGIPTNRGIRGKTAKCLLDLVAHGGYEFHIVCAEEGFTTAQNRIYMVVQAMKNKSDFILMVDDDMTFSANILDQLLASGKEIIGVNSYSRVLPLSTTLMLMDKDGNYLEPDKHPSWEIKIPEEVFEVLAIGTGVALIKMEVFKRIKKPWFKFEMHPDGYMKQGEDAWFCSQARKVGYKIWADGSIKVGHIGSIEYGENLKNVAIT